MHGNRLRSWPFLLLLLLPLAGSAYELPDPYRYRALPNALDLFETGLYWLRDFSGTGGQGDPASSLSAIEDIAARQFDFAAMAWATAGIHYLQMDILSRSHYQNRLRDRLFKELAHVIGMYDPTPPAFSMLMPRQTGIGTVQGGMLIRPRNRASQWLWFHFRFGPRGWKVVDVSVNGRLFTDYLRQRSGPVLH